MLLYLFSCGFPGGSDGKDSGCNARSPGLIPGSGRSPREGNGNPVQYSCLENPMGRGGWQATVHGVTKSQTQLSDFHYLFSYCGKLKWKESAHSLGDLGLIPGSGRSPGEGNGNPLQYSCLEKSHGRRNLVGYSPWGCKELDTTE